MNDYFKYLATTLFEYVEQPKDVRKQKRKERKAQRQPVSIRWFGLIPYALSHQFKKWNEAIRRRDHH